MKARSILQLERMPWARIFAGRTGTPRKILLVNGPPDPGPEQFTAALCDAYQAGVRSGGGEVRRLNMGADSRPIENALQEIDWASRITVICPLLGDKMPANLVTLFELASYRGVLPASEGQVRTILTMDYPAFAHRALLQDDGENIPNRRLSLPGCYAPVLVGSIQVLSPTRRAAWLDSLRGWGVQDCTGRDERRSISSA